MADKPDFKKVVDNAWEGDLTKVVLAISQGFDVNTYSRGWSFLHWIVDNKSGATKHIIEFLLSNAQELGLNVNAESDFADRWTPLLLASSDDLKNTSLDMLLKYAKETGLNVNYKSRSGRTGLIIAIERHAIENINTYARYLNELDISIRGVDTALKDMIIAGATNELKGEIKKVVERIKRIKK